ncbi:MAG: dihydroorotate dehydrogenase (quinone), partial [Pseudomonadota bacterium]
INLGANKNSDDRAADYVQGLMALEPHVSFLTVNVSSPNTAGLRDLQGKGALDDLLRRVMVARVLGKPVFVKVAPDLSDEDLADISASAIAAKVDGVIVSNTTISREGVPGRYREEAGGLSGRPLMTPSTAVLRAFAQEARGRLTFIGVGGVSSAKDVVTKLKAGASAVQLYTALVYKGPRLVKRIIKELPSVLHAEGFSSVHDAVGADING